MSLALQKRFIIADNNLCTFLCTQKINRNFVFVCKLWRGTKRESEEKYGKTCFHDMSCQTEWHLDLLLVQFSWHRRIIMAKFSEHCNFIFQVTHSLSTNPNQPTKNGVEKLKILLKIINHYNHLHTFKHIPAAEEDEMKKFDFLRFHFPCSNFFFSVNFLRMSTW
jgi:hypothetical protein